MGHRIFVGPFAALEAKWLEEIALRKQHDIFAPVTVLVGSNLLAAYLKIRIASKGRAIPNLRFYTFLDLARRLAGGSRGRSRLPDLGAAAILDSILSSNPPRVFHSVTGFVGFRNALLDTFRDLRDAGVAPDQLEEGIRRCSNETPDRGPHLTGLTELFSRYREQVGNFEDVDDDFRDACANAPKAPRILDGGQLLAYGIYDVTGQQSEFLAALKESLELRLFVPYVNEAVSSFARKFVEAQESQLGVAAEPLATCYPQTTLGRLAQEDFGFRRQGDACGHSLRDDGSVSLVSAPGDSRAAIEIAREVLRAVRDREVQGFHEVAVILRQPETEVPILTEAFRLRGIPHFVHGGTPFLRRPLARAVLSLARLEGNSFSRQAILTAMEWVSAALPECHSEEWNSSEWHSLTADPRFLAGVPAWDAGTEELVRESASNLESAEKHAALNVEKTDEEDRGAVPSLEAARLRLEQARHLRTAWLAIRGASADWPDSRPWTDWTRLLARRLEPLLKTSSDWGAFSNVLDRIGALGSMAGQPGIEGTIRRERLISVLEESFSALTRTEGRFMRNGVNLVSSGAARGLRFPLVVVSSLEEGKFPARLRQDPLLLDAERVKIGSPPRLPLKSQRMEEERLLFDMCARSAERRLVLVSSRLDESSDRERIPSEFFLRVAAALRGSAVSLRDLSEGIVPGFRSVSLEQPSPRAGQVAVDRGEVRLRLVTGGTGPARAVLKLLAREEPELLSGPLAFDDARWKGHLTAFDGRISDPALTVHVAGTLGPGAGPVSASRLESYAKCPYLFYLKRVMGLEAPQEPEALQTLMPMARGEVIHEVLKAFLRKHGGEELPVSDKEILRASLVATAGPILEKARPAGMRDLLWEIEREGLERILINWLDFEKDRAGMRPAFLERPFGRFNPSESYPELTILAGRHKFVFRGRIDRIDLSENGTLARVIDYKTGKLPETMEKRTRPLLMAGEKMQIAIYRQILRSLEGLELVEEIIGEYLHLRPWGGQVVRCSFASKELKEASERLPALLEIIGDGIESGVFFARSAGSVRPEGHCRWCDYLDICGKDRTQREERKAGDPQVLKFDKMRDADAPREVEG